MRNTYIALKPKRIIKPQEFEALLKNAPPELLPIFVLGGFCALSTGKILRLDWWAVDFDKKTVIIENEIMPLYRRVVPLPDAAAAWLTPLANDSGDVVPARSFDLLMPIMGRVWKAAGIQRDDHILVLSAICYQLVLSGRAPQTTEGCDKPPSMLIEPRPHKAEAKKWFSILPPEHESPEA